MPGNIVNQFEFGADLGQKYAGNYSKFEQDGTMQAMGDATVWDDIVQSLIGQRLFSVVGKVDYNYDNNSITMQSAGSMAQANDRIIFNLEKRHGLKTASTFKLHAHWEQVSANKIEWTTDYRIQQNGTAKTTSWTRLTANSTDNSAFAYSAGTLNQITELADIDLSTAGLSATVNFRIVRDDSTAGDIEVVFIDAHAEWDMLGSRTEYTK